MTVDNKQCIAVIRITPITKWHTICEHDQLLRLNIIFFHVFPVAHKICTTTAKQFILSNFSTIIAGEFIISIYFSIKCPNSQFVLSELLHHAMYFTDKSHALFICNTATHVHTNTNINFLISFHTRHNSI